jgi:hypothetical protein
MEHTNRGVDAAIKWFLVNFFLGLFKKMKWFNFAYKVANEYPLKKRKRKRKRK